MAGSLPFCAADPDEDYPDGGGTDLRSLWLLLSELDREELEFHVVWEQVVEMMCSWIKHRQQVEEAAWSCWQ